MRHVTLVTGPPCGGKTTWVHEHAEPDHIVVCFDELAQQAGSLQRHDHAPHHREAAAAEYDAELQRVADMVDGTAWVIRCAPSPHEREHLRSRLRADHVVVLAPDLDEALHRARLDGRIRRTYAAIRHWYRIASTEPIEEAAELVTSRDW